MSGFTAGSWATSSTKDRSKSKSRFDGVATIAGYHPVVQEIIKETLDKMVPQEEKVSPPQNEVYEFTKGDWTYTIGWSRPRVTVDANKSVVDRETGMRVSFKEPRTLRFSVAIMICRNNKTGLASMRRLMKSNGKLTFTDCRVGGLGTGLNRDTLAKTLPGKLTQRDRERLVSWLEYAYSQIN